MAALVLFFRLIIRPMLRNWARSMLVMAAVALGVAVVLAIDLAGNAAAGSFRSSMETLAGNNDLEVTAAGGVREETVGALAQTPYPLRITPRIEDYATVVHTGETIPVIGVDMIAEAGNSDHGEISVIGGPDAFEHINDADAIWVTHSLSPEVGDKLTLLINDQARDYTVRGFIPDFKQGSGDAILMDIGAAQRATGKAGRVDRILVKVPDRPSIETWQQRL